MLMRTLSGVNLAGEDDKRIIALKIALRAFRAFL